MALIDTHLLLEVHVVPTAAKVHAAPLQAAADRFGINTPARVAGFLGQCLHETARLTSFEEGFWYTTAARVVQMFPSRVPTIEAATPLLRNPQALANRVYANRYGNGDEASGEGWMYRGRGGGHLTFKNNYRAAASALGRPYVEQPELVALPEDAALTFAWYFASRRCNEAADVWDIPRITRAVNPGNAGAVERMQLSSAVLRALGQ